MTAEELMHRYAMARHEENGAFAEQHYADHSGGRAASGCMYYYVAAEEKTAFHRIDCDEYWCYAQGAPLEVWQVDGEGWITVERLGIEQDCQPVIYVPQGRIFAARHPAGAANGTFLSCITVPRFQYEGCTLFDREAILQRYPALSDFYR